ncbi:MAG TPA: hypothetical protein EYP04_13675 [Anaerolineae bacterium]|nr:hypothetical protein [Anaerolineae bacterium]HIQ05839.1 hypothetical protein [Anaerolineae bacterium]
MPDEAVRIWYDGEWKEVTIQVSVSGPTTKVPIVPEAERLIQRGVEMLQWRDLAQAEQRFRQALKVDPRAVPAYNNLASIHRYRGELDEARLFLLCHF